MKKIWLLVVLLTIGVLGHLLWAGEEEPGLGLSESDTFTLMGRSEHPMHGAVMIYYDDISKSMVIRIRDKGSSPKYYYCYENDNPKLYSIVLTFIQRCLDSYQNCYNKNSDNSWANGNGYFYIRVWYKQINGKNIIKGIGTVSS